MTGPAPSAGPAVTDFPRFAATDTARDCRAKLESASFEDASIVAVVDGARLLGAIDAGRALTADPDATLGSLMKPAVVLADGDSGMEVAANEMVRRGAPAIAVLDGGGELVGLVGPDRAAIVLLTEHDEDMARLGGYQASSQRARLAAEEPVSRRLWHRLPWLLIGLVGSMASAVLVGIFEEQLDRVVLLAFFVPAVVYIADSVGTQTETLLIRALATDIDLRKVIPRELLTGVVLGATVALLFYPFARLGWDSPDVALAVSLALLCSCTIATAVAMALPITLRRLGFDPAFGSGPLATVIQDLLSIAIYFSIAVPIAT